MRSYSEYDNSRPVAVETTMESAIERGPTDEGDGSDGLVRQPLLRKERKGLGKRVSLPCPHVENCTWLIRLQ